MPIKITLDDLAGDQYDIAECIGIDAYIKLVETFGGTSIYIIKADTLGRSERDDKIRADFNGANYKYLANKYNLTERTIRQIISPELERIRNEPLEGQTSFFD